ncbi:MAG: hypothetical protein FVQ85_15550 [Planctomycetes bacterium]|nr:hypothetical protein [Planctomycetota bacterium]
MMKSLPVNYRVIMLLFILPALVAAKQQARGSKDVPYGVGSWPAAGLGNHRACIYVTEKADAVRVRIPWRRRDALPEKKAVVVIDATTGKKIKNVLAVRIHRQFGELVFQPATAPGEYFFYYTPCNIVGNWWHPSTKYTLAVSTADPAWIRRCGLKPGGLERGRWRLLPRGQVRQIQARTEFGRMDPMEVIATTQETEELCSRQTEKDFLLFPEDRRFPIRMTDELPLRWVRKGPANVFHGRPCRGEFFTFQIGIYAHRQPLEEIGITYTDLVRAKGSLAIPASALGCFNLGGTDWLGRSFKRKVNVEKGGLQALWFGLLIPEDAAPGAYEGKITLKPKNAAPERVKLSLEISGKLLADAGDNDLWRHARLRWLDSTIAVDDEVFAPYTPVVVNKDAVSILGRRIRFNKSGLLENIESTFSQAVDSIENPPIQILAQPMRFVVETEAGAIAWSGGKARITQRTSGSATWQSRSTGGNFTLQCRAKMECDGYINYQLKLKTDRPAKVKDIRLEIPVRSDIATYMMGMGCKGGYRPEKWQWRWNPERANNMLWLGNVNAGVQCKLKGDKDAWHLYGFGDTALPDSWSNSGRGGCTVTQEAGGVVLIRAYSGPRSLEKGQELLFRFGLLITPVKMLDQNHWQWRYYHAYRPVGQIAQAGGRIINIHHATEINPFINYPFIAVDALKKYVDEAHRHDIKVKLYYTVRELSVRTAELWALRSLGHEIFSEGAGGGTSWLNEHLVKDYEPAWHDPTVSDASIRTTGLSRWHNYYLEGMAWLLRNVGIDGLYLDGIGYDREIIKRLRKVMNRTRPGCLIDFHSGNNFDPRYGLNSPANQYMEHFPFIDSLWFGEGYNYNESPDYWLVEVSGIPFGLFGEMLQGCGNAYRGMVYGMGTRFYHSCNPSPIWKLWDQFGISDAKMLGYWAQSCPVQTGCPDVLATAYVKNDKTLVALASWAAHPVKCTLKIDWPALGLDPDRVRIEAPAVEGLQEAGSYDPEEPILVAPGRGLLLMILPESRQPNPDH